MNCSTRLDISVIKRNIMIAVLIFNPYKKNSNYGNKPFRKIHLLSK